MRLAPRCYFAVTSPGASCDAARKRVSERNVRRVEQSKGGPLQAALCR